MRGALIHGVLLVVMLVYGYRTWTRDKVVETTQGNVVLWDKSEAELVSIEYKAPKKIVKIDRKPEGYWWGTDTTIETKPKAKPPAAGSGAGSGSAGSAAGSAAGSGSAGSGAGSGSAATPPPVEEEEVGRKSHEFPLGDTADKLIKDLTSLHALRDLGVPSEDNKKEYKLADSKTTLTIAFKDGPKTFTIGGPVYGASGDKYVVDQATGKAYVFAKELMSGLEVGESTLHLVDPKGFDVTKIDEVVIEAGGKSKTVTRIETEADGQKKKTWADADTKKPNQMAANFVDNANGLRPTEYAADLKLSDLTLVMKLTYKGDKGGVLGTLTLYRFEKPGQLAPEQELDPANPPKGVTEYYVMTERTHIPGLVRMDSAQRIESDLELLYSGKQPEEAGSGAGSGHSIDPKGNPFGGNPPGHGATPPPGGGLKPGAGGLTPPPVPTPGGPTMTPASGGSGAAPKPAMGSAAPAPTMAPKTVAPAGGGATPPAMAPKTPTPATPAPAPAPKPAAPPAAAGGTAK